MKKILIPILLSCSLQVSSQIASVDNTLNKFIGTWRWSFGTDTILIVLEKQVYTIPMNGSNTETIVGWHKYVKNGNIIQSSMQYISRNVNLDFTDPSNDFKTTLIGSTYQTNPNKVYFTTFWDLALHKSFDMFFTMLPNTMSQAKWELREPRGIYRGPSGFSGVFVMPKNLIFTKL